MDALKERLAEADSQYSDLVDELETARNNLFEEEDADKKADLRMVYEDVMSMVDKTGTRVVQLEAALYGNGGTVSPRRGAPPMTNTYGSVPMYGSTAPNPCVQPKVAGPTNGKGAGPGRAQIRSMIAD
ncbi:g8699 [Coccomyxa viridis]|uniref:G8699 protein n=1 Tax=Coccomyxa viridis TaxID=1274662 RepID=A0ABP1G7D9_9CHLO